MYFQGSWWIPQSERRASSAAEDQLVDMCHDEWTSIMGTPPSCTVVLSIDCAGHKPPCTVEAMFPLPTATPACSDKSRRQLYQLRCNVYRTLGALARVWRRVAAAVHYSLPRDSPYQVPTLKCRLIELVGAAVSAAQSGRTSPNHLELVSVDAGGSPSVHGCSLLFSFCVTPCSPASRMHPVVLWLRPPLFFTQTFLQ